VGGPEGPRDGTHSSVPGERPSRGAVGTSAEQPIDGVRVRWEEVRRVGWEQGWGFGAVGMSTTGTDGNRWTCKRGQEGIEEYGDVRAFVTSHTAGGRLSVEGGVWVGVRV